MKTVFLFSTFFAALFWLTVSLSATAQAQNTSYGTGGGTWTLKPEFLQTTNNRKNAPTPPNMQDRRVHTCQETADCMAVNPPCGRLVAVNKDAAPQVQAWYDYVRGSMNCLSKPDDSAWSAVCRNRTCTMAKSGGDVPAKSNPAYCQKESDCMAVTDNCQRISAFNKTHAPQEQARFDAMKGARAQCDWVSTSHLTGLTCTDHLCKAVLSNYPAAK